MPEPGQYSSLVTFWLKKAYGLRRPDPSGGGFVSYLGVLRRPPVQSLWVDRGLYLPVELNGVPLGTLG